MELLVIESTHQYIRSLPNYIYRLNPHFQQEHQQLNHNTGICNIKATDFGMFLMEMEDYSTRSSVS